METLRFSVAAIACSLVLGMPVLSPPAQGAQGAPLSPAEIAERTIPSVVLIKVSGGLGSGFIVGADGRIATNLHVIRGASEATVVLADGREFDAVEVVALDEQQDLALLRIPTDKLKSLPLGDSAKVRPGERVVAIGHPLGLGNTVSDGLVSAVRQVEAALTVLQISAPLSPGSSGGPLLNERGEVIGISTLIVTRGQNLNFAVPINALKPLLGAQQRTPLARWRWSQRRTLKRSIPRHELSLLDGCSTDDLTQIMSRIEQAIEVGAPLYNAGNHEACFRIYEGAALELDRKVRGCSGPRRALLDGVRRSEQLSSYDEKAWAMRDAFDGLVALVERRSQAVQGDAAPAPALPTPVYPVSVLSGCSAESITRITDTITRAIDEGGPLYNNGNVEGCVRVYAEAIRQLERRLPGCRPFKRVLAARRQETDRKSGLSDKAWLMRGAFDAILDVIARPSR